MKGKTSFLVEKVMIQILYISTETNSNLKIVYARKNNHYQKTAPLQDNAHESEVIRLNNFQEIKLRNSTKKNGTTAF